MSEWPVHNLRPGVASFPVHLYFNGTSALTAANTPEVIGRNGESSMVHALVFEDASPGLYEVIYTFTDPEAVNYPGACGIDAITVTDLGTRPGEWRVECLVSAAGAVLLLDAIESVEDAAALPSGALDSIVVRRIGDMPTANAKSTRKDAVRKDWQVVDPASFPFDDFAGLFVRIDETAGEVAYFEEPLAGEDPAVLDAHLAAAFPSGWVQLTAEEQALTILSYIAQALPLHLKLHTGTQTLLQGYGNCYLRTLAYVALCRHIGLPARGIRMCRRNPLGVDLGDHVVAEVHYDGAWHGMDPTYGTFFYSKDTWDGTGTILPTSTVRADATLGDNLFQIDVDLWTGTYVPTIAVRRMPGDYLPEGYTWTQGVPLKPFLQAFIATAFPQGAPLFADRTLSCPIHLDFQDTDTVEIGTADGSYSDSADQIGDAGHSAMIHAFRFGNAQPGAYRITYTFYRGDLVCYPGTIDLIGVSTLQTATMAGHWQIDCQVLESGAVLLVDVIEAAEIAPFYHAVDAITVEKLP